MNKLVEGVIDIMYAPIVIISAIFMLIFYSSRGHGPFIAYVIIVILVLVLAYYKVKGDL